MQPQPCCLCPAGLRALIKPDWFAAKGRQLPRPARPPPKLEGRFDQVGAAGLTGVGAAALTGVSAAALTVVGALLLWPQLAPGKQWTDSAASPIRPAMQA